MAAKPVTLCPRCERNRAKRGVFCQPCATALSSKRRTLPSEPGYKQEPTLNTWFTTAEARYEQEALTERLVGRLDRVSERGAAEGVMLDHLGDRGNAKEEKEHDG